MIAQNYNVIGVMSGTSLDGVDLAHIYLHFNNGTWAYTIEEAETIPYPDSWVNVLKNAVDLEEGSLNSLNKDYTILLGSLIKGFIDKHKIHGLDAVCSHGHTVLHQPGRGITLQIGNLPEIASLVKQTVVCDFRVQDVQLNGQGAPLVPIGDKLLFSNFDYCLNLGGFSNISFDDKGKRIAYDICAVNTVLNFYANKLDMEYDAGGEVASSGKILDNLLQDLNDLEYYKLHYPKSLGFEYVKTTLLPLIEKYPAAIADKLKTFNEHIAVQIAATLTTKGASILVTGGGAYNTFLLERIKELSPNTTVVIPDDKTLQYKEALIFALLGILKLRGEVNVLSSVTGATKDHSSGRIYTP